MITPLPSHHPITGEKLYTPEAFKKVCKQDLDEVASELYVKLQKKNSHRTHGYA